MTSWKVWRRAFRAARVASSTVLALVLVNTALIVASSLSISNAVSIAASAAPKGRLLDAIFLVVILLSGTAVISAFISPLCLVIERAIVQHQVEELAQRISRLESEGTRNDSSNSAALLERVVSERHRESVGSIADLLRVRSRGLAGFAILASISVPAAVALAICVILYGRAFTAFLDDILSSMASDGPLALRRARYVRGLQFDHSIAGELRVYKALPWLIGAFATLSTLGRREAAQSRETHARPLILLSLLAVVGFAGVLAYLLWDAGSGSLSIGALAFAIQGALLVLELGPAGDVAVLFGEAARTEKRIDELSILGDDGPRVARSAPTDPLTLVAFDRVQFTYPAGQAPAVDITSLHVRRGEKIAVVGRNGAGKSTLFGLLAGTLATSAGTIEMADDVHVSIALQRATRYPTTIEDNIRLGDPEVDVDAALAVTGSDGALGATRLSEHIGDPAEGTTQISGGQWQRVGLARAFGRRADLLLLDEPSAALDPESEAEFFRAALATPSVETVMLSTHHLANVRFVDRVIVLDAGRVVEDGSHADLMRANGLYARLFESQAKAYEGKGS